MQLVSMGFDMEGCKKAVFHTHNQGGSTGVCCNLSYHVLPLYMTLEPHLLGKGNGQAGHCYETASKCTLNVARAIIIMHPLVAIVCQRWACHLLNKVVPLICPGAQ